MKDFNRFLNEQFDNKDFAQEYYRQAIFYRLADQLLLLRKKRGLTQSELAEKAGTTQAVVSRLENVSVRPSLETIVKIAEALDAVVDVQLTPIKEKMSSPGSKDQASKSKEQKQTEALKGIIYFGRSEASRSKEDLKWSNPLLEEMSLSSRPPIGLMGRKKKAPEFA